ncbi:ABC-type transport system [Terrimicrobium sacchariphilum]|uniref:ABC-type transport system n=1 Tax=Terrimicrobium sacchariphilum TaxID=690879 RepID=A0A146G2S9_TERSA|nr:cytochrome c biogenesis protein CcsA [Terrimicrobium sacchariphilum]GAT31971.1 ABC-type transport system [Terrimicrobium sacchariphilum]
MLRSVLALLLGVTACVAADFSVLEGVPIQEQGRKKPYLVFAQETTLALAGKTAVSIDGRRWSAPELVTTLWLNPAGWETKPLILINNRDLKKAIGLDPMQKLFAYQDLETNPQLRQLLSEAQTLRMKPGSARLSGLPKEASDVGMQLAEFESLVNGSAFRFIANPRGEESPWFAVPADQVSALRDALIRNDAEAFRTESLKLKTQWAAAEPALQPPAWRISLELIYQKLHPFRWAWILYLGAGLSLSLSFRFPLAYKATWALAVAGLLFQIAGFTSRVLIAGRAPVTNMYESILWVAFGTVLFALIFEAIYRSRYFLLGAIPVAVVSLILADTQTIALSPAINPLTAVLRNNFWLTTHVLSITLSYAAFALALGIAHIALIQILAGKKPAAPIYNYLYRTLQVGVLLLATGTILGGVWANYSWGRFWDWDPKETWALITLLGYLIVLHGRIAGYWGGFGMAVGSVISFLAVLMAWYGVNFVLGVGLHSYGFGTGGFGWALAFVAAELVFVAAAFARNRTLRSSPGAKSRSKAEEQVVTS